MQELTPELAQYFGVSANSGVLVADIGNDAQKAGIQRGDILTQIDGRPVTTLAQLSGAAAAAISGGDSKVTLTLRRGNTIHLLTLNTGQVNARP
jgi:serine protease Do